MLGAHLFDLLFIYLFTEMTIPEKYTFHHVMTHNVKFLFSPWLSYIR